MAVDGGFDLLGMNLEAADIDDAVLAPDEVVARAAKLDQVAGIDEVICIAKGRGAGADILRIRS
jgi:hypothetical protein